MISFVMYLYKNNTRQSHFINSEVFNLEKIISSLSIKGENREEKKGKKRNCFFLPNKNSYNKEKKIRMKKNDVLVHATN